MRVPAILQHTLAPLALILGGCGYTVIHQRLVPLQAEAATESVRIACAQGHIRILPIYVNTQRGQPRRNFDHFTLAVEYTDMPVRCSTGDVTLARPGQDADMPAEEIVKSRRYPDRPDTLTCFYRMRNILEAGGIYHLNLHPAASVCPAQAIRYRFEIQREHRLPVEK
jgi:hypothetical protein